MAATLEVDVSFAARRPWVPRRGQFQTWAEAALEGGLAGARLASRVLSIRVVGALTSRRLNSQYRHKDKPTNVLSFSGAGMAGGIHYLGELVICAPVVAREALKQHKTPTAHWAHLTVHGVLHLLGFDHEHDEEAVKMAAREVQILDRLGFSDPYL